MSQYLVKVVDDECRIIKIYKQGDESGKMEILFRDGDIVTDEREDYPLITIDNWRDE